MIPIKNINEDLLEIGGFFEFPEFDCKKYKQSALFYLKNVNKNILFFRDGRQSIKSVLLNIGKIEDKTCYLPSYLCYSILQPFKELKLKVKFYNHLSPLKPLIRGDIKNSIIFIVDYFGTEPVSKEEIHEFISKQNIVILDATHSLLDEDRLGLVSDNLYIIASLRKIFPIPDGGILYHADSNFRLKQGRSNGYKAMIKAMKLKKSYLNMKESGSALKNIKNTFLKTYQGYEETKNNNAIKVQRIPGISIDILKKINILEIIKKRQNNIEFLYKNISDKGCILFNKNDIKSPFIMPLVFKNEEKRDAAKKLLINNKIYPQIHWNIKGIISDNYFFEHQLSKRILSIPIDQRYNSKILSRVACILN